MTDFVRRVLRPEQPDWAVRSLMDVDFYKFTMGYFIWKHYRGVQVTFTLINRNPKLPLAKLVDEYELRRQLDHVRTLTFRRGDRKISTNMYYLRGMDVYGERMFPEEYLQFLQNDFHLPPYQLSRVGDQYVLTFTGPWELVTFWETIALAVVCELLYRKLMRSMSEPELHVLYGNATDKLYNKLRRLKERPWIRFADFGQRRRHSFLWQRFAIEMACEVMGEQFTGTSNTWMAFNQDLVPIGTNAHELPMVLTAIAGTWEERLMAQYDVLRKWENLFPQGALRVALPDTYGSAQFFRNMPEDLAEHVARNWRGLRLDSGDPIKEALFYIEWLKKYGVDPIRDGKIVIPSDGLDVVPMFEIDDALQGKIAHPYGWGTNFTNGFAECHPRGSEMAVIDGIALPLTNDQLFRGQSIVVKVSEANGDKAVKLSNNIKKATGDLAEVKKYIEIFGSEGQVSQEVFV